jgi:hypothetical protein
MVFEVLLSVLRLLADVSEHLVCSDFWVEVIRLHYHFDPEDGTGRMFRNVGQQE